MIGCYKSAGRQAADEQATGVKEAADANLNQRIREEVPLITYHGFTSVMMVLTSCTLTHTHAHTQNSRNYLSHLSKIYRHLYLNWTLDVSTGPPLSFVAKQILPQREGERKGKGEGGRERGGNDEETEGGESGR